MSGPGPSGSLERQSQAANSHGAQTQHRQPHSPRMSSSALDSLPRQHSDFATHRQASAPPLPPAGTGEHEPRPGSKRKGPTGTGLATLSSVASIARNGSGRDSTSPNPPTSSATARPHPNHVAAGSSNVLSGLAGVGVGAEMHQELSRKRHRRVAQAESKGMSLAQHIEFFDLIANRLNMNRRAERDWGTLYLEGASKYRSWWYEAFPSVSLYKQKGKLLFCERRGRVQLGFWKALVKRKEQMRGSESLVDIVAHELSKRANAYPMPGGNLAEAAVHPWSFTTEAKVLCDKLARGEKGPGSILDWPETGRRALLAKMVELHRQYGDGFEGVSKHFNHLVVQAEVELAVLSVCDCSSCKAWGVGDARGRAPELRLLWSRRRAALVRSVLELHQEYRDDEHKVAQLARSRHTELEFWSDDAIFAFVKVSHGHTTCDVCLASSSAGIAPHLPSIAGTPGRDGLPDDAANAIPVPPGMSPPLAHAQDARARPHHIHHQAPQEQQPQPHRELAMERLEDALHSQRHHRAPTQHAALVQHHVLPNENPAQARVDQAHDHGHHSSRNLAQQEHSHEMHHDPRRAQPQQSQHPPHQHAVMQHHQQHQHHPQRQQQQQQHQERRDQVQDGDQRGQHERHGHHAEAPRSAAVSSSVVPTESVSHPHHHAHQQHHSGQHDHMGHAPPGAPHQLESSRHEQQMRHHHEHHPHRPQHPQQQQQQQQQHGDHGPMQHAQPQPQHDPRDGRDQHGTRPEHPQREPMQAAQRGNEIPQRHEISAARLDDTRHGYSGPRSPTFVLLLTDSAENRFRVIVSSDPSVGGAPGPKVYEGARVVIIYNREPVTREWREGSTVDALFEASSNYPMSERVTIQIDNEVREHIFYESLQTPRLSPTIDHTYLVGLFGYPQSPFGEVRAVLYPLLHARRVLDAQRAQGRVLWTRSRPLNLRRGASVHFRWTSMVDNLIPATQDAALITGAPDAVEFNFAFQGSVPPVHGSNRVALQLYGRDLDSETLELVLERTTGIPFGCIPIRTTLLPPRAPHVVIGWLGDHQEWAKSVQAELQHVFGYEVHIRNASRMLEVSREVQSATIFVCLAPAPGSAMRFFGFEEHELRFVNHACEAKRAIAILLHNHLDLAQEFAHSGFHFPGLEQRLAPFACHVDTIRSAVDSAHAFIQGMLAAAIEPTESLEMVFH